MNWNGDEMSFGFWFGWNSKLQKCRFRSSKHLKTSGFFLGGFHQEMRKFYAEKDPDYLGHVSLWDPAMGWLNLIRALRVGLYHDELHVEQIQDVLQRIRN